MPVLSKSVISAIKNGFGRIQQMFFVFPHPAAVARCSFAAGAIRHGRAHSARHRRPGLGVMRPPRGASRHGAGSAASSRLSQLEERRRRTRLAATRPWLECTRQVLRLALCRRAWFRATPKPARDWVSDEERVFEPRHCLVGLERQSIGTGRGSTATPALTRFERGRIQASGVRPDRRVPPLRPPMAENRTATQIRIAVCGAC